MATTIRGIIRNGVVEPLEPLSGVDGTVVTITVPEFAPTVRHSQRLRRGMFKELGEFTEEDFKSAEWHGDPDDGLDWSAC